MFQIRSIYKILKPCVRELLTEIEGTEGSIAFLDFLESVWKAYVCEVTPTLERLKYAVDSAYFPRYWKQYCKDNKISSKHFMTKNAWDGLEINLAMLLRLIIDKEAHNIFQHTSQNVEGFFRKSRSYSSVGSSVVNFDAKDFESRAHKIAFEENVYTEIKDIKFPKLDKRESLPIREPEEFTESEIREAIAEGIELAKKRALGVGITNFAVDVKQLLTRPKDRKTKNKNTKDPESDDSEEEDENEPKDPFEIGNLNHQEDDEEGIDEILCLQDVNFTSEETGDIKTMILRPKFKLFYIL